MPTLTLIVAVLTLSTGSVALWVNPKRFVNQAFALLSATTTMWLLFVSAAIMTGSRIRIDPNADPVPWIRWASGAAAFLPWIIWLVKDAILFPDKRFHQIASRSWPWLLASIVLAGICFSYYFIPESSTPTNPKRGSGYLIYSVASVVLYLVLVVIAYQQMRRSAGIKRIEMQFLTFNMGLMCLTIVTLTAVASYFNIRSLSRVSPIIIFVFYVLTAWSITLHRVFDARQVFLSVVQRLTLVAILSITTIATWKILEPSIPGNGSLILSVAIWSTLAFWLEAKTRDWLRLSPLQSIAAMRQTSLDLARKEPDPNRLVAEFEALLRSSCQTNYAVLLFDSGEVFVSGDIEFAKDRTGYAALGRQGWTTPESLQRLRPEPGLVDLRQFLTEFNLGLIVTAPRGSPSPSLLLALGVKTNHRPFTYPEVQQVQEMAEFMDNILARSRLSLQARQSEQLATIGLIGASLAHEIRNPLVSIKTFSHLLPSRFDDPEFRRRFAVLIPAEVDRIDNLTQQLLDLSNPRRHQMELVSLHGILQETTDLMLTRANDARVQLSAELTATTDVIWADAGAVRQVLINLLINAFQAMESQEGARRVQLRSRNSQNGSVILEVSDNGPGIPPEQRSRLFHPFVSTKTKGMGLGLAVCADILHEHRATIIVPDTGRPGATFRITFPCPPPSS
jgi:signal transduction histidine kinase